MKLLSKAEAQNSIRKSNEELVDKSFRLQEVYRGVVKKLNAARTNYDPQKAKALKDFEDFVRDLQTKKAKLLEELNTVQVAIDEKKEIYYGYMAKADELIEQKYQADERDKKLDLRERFINELEKRHGLLP